LAHPAPAKKPAARANPLPKDLVEGGYTAFTNDFKGIARYCNSLTENSVLTTVYFRTVGNIHRPEWAEISIAEFAEDAGCSETNVRYAIEALSCRQRRILNEGKEPHSCIPAWRHHPLVESRQAGKSREYRVLYKDIRNFEKRPQPVGRKPVPKKAAADNAGAAAGQQAFQPITVKKGVPHADRITAAISRVEYSTDLEAQVSRELADGVMKISATHRKCTCGVPAADVPQTDGLLSATHRKCTCGVPAADVPQTDGLLPGEPEWAEIRAGMKEEVAPRTYSDFERSAVFRSYDQACGGKLFLKVRDENSALRWRAKFESLVFLVCQDTVPLKSIQIETDCARNGRAP
jgi:hypothetical protein